MTKPTAIPKTDARRQTLLTEKQTQILRRNQWLAKWFDAKFGIPGTRFQFGIESLIGLIPGVGDYLGALMSAAIVADAARAGVSKPVLGRMVGNVLLEMLVGVIPIVGDIFDIWFKANIRNTNLLQQELEKTQHAEIQTEEKTKDSTKLWLVGFVIGLLACITTFWLTIGWLIFG